VRLADLKDAPYNPQTIGEANRARLAESLARYGYVEPIVLNTRTGHIVSGHKRREDLLAKGFQEADACVVDLPLEEEKALNVLLNSPHVRGEYDYAKLSDLLTELTELVPGLDELGLGFQELKLDAEGALRYASADRHGQDLDGDGDEAGNVKARAKAGDLWEAGRHRLLCGDCTDPASFARLLAGDRVHVVFADPPYEWTAQQTVEVLCYVEPWLARHAWLLLMHSDRGQIDVGAILPRKWRLASMVVWYHGTSLLFGKVVNTRAPIQCHQLISRWRRGKAPFDYRPAKHYVEEKAFRSVVQLKSLRRDPDARKHEKPEDLYGLLFSVHGRRGRIVLEPWAGSGAGLAVAERLGMAWRGIELDPTAVDVALDRWERQAEGTKGKKPRARRAR